MRLVSTHLIHHGSMSGSSADADTTAPVLVSAPVNGHDATTDLVFTFSEPVKLGSGTLIMMPNYGPGFSTDVATSPYLSVSGNTITFNPPAPLDLKTAYMVQLTQGAVLDLAGNSVANSWGVVVNFTTGISTTPVNTPGTDADDLIHGSGNLS